MGNGSGPGSINSRVFTNSFSGKERAMAFPLKPNNYFGFQNKKQYAYNIYYQLAYNGAGFGSRGERWARANNVNISFTPPY